MTNRRCGIALIACTALLGGCSGVTRNSSPLLPTTSQSSKTNVTFVFNANAPQSATQSRAEASAQGAKPQYLSPATKSISMAIAGPTNVTQTQDLTVNSSGCSSTLASTQCTLILSLAPCPSPPTNCYTASVTTYDQTGGAGSPLSAAQTIAFTVTEGQSNSVDLALSGVPAKTLVVSTDSLSSGNSSDGYGLIGQGAHAFVAESLDADGNIIVGAGAPLFTISAPNGALFGVTTSPSTTTASAPNTFAVTPPTAYSNGSASFTVTPTFAGQATDGCAQPGAACAPVTVTVAMKYRLFAFVANQYDDDVSAYVVNPTTGALVPVVGSPFAAGGQPLAVAVDPTGKFAYVTNDADDTVSAYTINATSGALAPVAGSPFASGSAPLAVAVDPSGKFAYVTNQVDDTVSAYTINVTTGALAPAAGSPFATGSYPAGAAVDPSGKFAYVVNGNDDTVSAYTIDAATGALTPVAGAPVVTGVYPRGIAIAPSSMFAYVTNQADDTVSAYTINATTGALTPAGSPVATGNSPYDVTVDPTGAFAYVTNQGDSAVSAYSINAVSGALTPVAGSPFTAGANPAGIAVDPTGAFAFVVNCCDNDVSTFAINATSGALAQIAGSPVATGLSPIAIAVGGSP